MLGHRSLDVADYLFILKRRRWLILSFAILFPIVAAVITRFIPPKYLSQTLVLIQEQKVPDEYVKPVIASNLDSRLSSMKEQILSRSRVQPIIEQYNLYASSHMTMDERVDQTRKAIDIKPIHSAISNAGGLPGFFITFTASDAHTAQLVCGEITSLFLNENLRSREATVTGTTDFLKGQLADAKRNLDEQDSRLATFQRQYFGKLPSEEGSNMGMMNSLNTQLEAATQSLSQLERDKIYQESMLSQQLAAVPPPMQLTPSSVASFDPGAGTPQQQKELQGLEDKQAELTTEYTPSHPDVIAVKRQIVELKKQMAPAPLTASGAPMPARVAADPLPVQQLRAQIRATEQGIQEKRREQSGIQGRLGMYQERIQSSPQVEEEYKGLTRDYDTAKKFYDDLLVKIEHSKMAGDLERRQEGEQFRVMDEPNLPDAPSFPKVWVFALAGLTLGLLTGVGIAAYKEYKDTSLRNERDVWAFTRLPTLGIISVSGTLPAEHVSPSFWYRFTGRFRRGASVKADPNSLADARG